MCQEVRYILKVVLANNRVSAFSTTGPLHPVSGQYIHVSKSIKPGLEAPRSFSYIWQPSQNTSFSFQVLFQNPRRGAIEVTSIIGRRIAATPIPRVALVRSIPDKKNIRAPSIGRDDARPDIRPFGIGGGDYTPAFRHIMPVEVIIIRIPAY